MHIMRSTSCRSLLHRKGSSVRTWWAEGTSTANSGPAIRFSGSLRTPIYDRSSPADSASLPIQSFTSWESSVIWSGTGAVRRRDL